MLVNGTLTKTDGPIYAELSADDLGPYDIYHVKGWKIGETPYSKMTAIYSESFDTLNEAIRHYTNIRALANAIQDKTHTLNGKELEQ